MAQVRDLPIIGFYDKQRFPQYNPADCANWYVAPSKLGKKQIAAYPAMGRRHINFLGLNRLVFAAEPRAVFKSVNYWYVVVVNSIFRIDKFYNVIDISQGMVTTFSGNVFSDYLVVSQLPGQPSFTFVGFVDGQHIYIYREETGAFDIITDGNAPTNPTYIKTFGNRFVVAGGNTSQFNLSEINLGGAAFNPATAWTIAGNAIFAQEVGVIRGFAVLHNILYIFTDYKTGIWANIPSIFISAGGTETDFPWKKSTSNDFDFGLADSLSLDVGFGMMVWVGQNAEGLIQILASDGSPPKPISSSAISVLFQSLTTDGNLSPFLTAKKEGFLYSYEDTIFYRLSAGPYDPTELIEAQNLGNAIEYNFKTQSWHRVIEKNGQRNRIQKHVFFNNIHFVTVFGQNTIYQMSGHFYDNEIENPAATSSQDANAYLREPFRYEMITKNIHEQDYAEFETEYVEIDFVWGFQTFIMSTNPFPNAVFLIDEDPSPIDGEPQFIVAEGPGPDNDVIYILAEQGNLPEPDSLTYNSWFKPHIELYWSDDGGISFQPADVKQFSDLGVYQWRMRWYQLGPSRNRVYKLICYSPSPIVILGGVMMIRRLSGGAN